MKIWVGEIWEGVVVPARDLKNYYVPKNVTATRRPRHTVC